MPIIEISQEFYAIFEARAKEKGFSNADAYVQFVLKEIIDKIGNAKKSSPEKTPDRTYSKQEEETIKNRLRSLGYID